MAKKAKAKRGGAKKAAAKKAAKPAKKSAKSAKSASAKKPAKKPAAKKPAAKKPAVKAKPAKAAKPKAANAAKPQKASEHEADVGSIFEGEENTNLGNTIVVEESGTRISDLAGKAMIVQILGDAEAYFIDWSKLSDGKRAELIQHHLAAFDQRKRDEGKADWAETFVPLALLGESMPPVIRGRFDLSAPHEGLILIHPVSNALLYAASKDDEKLAILAPDLETIAPHESFVSELFDPEAQSYAFTVDRSQSQGFTLGEIETLMQTGGAELTLV